jgi:hypothetical protein
MFRDESPDMQAAMVQAAAMLLATGKYTTEEAADAVRTLRAVLRCDPLKKELENVPF